MIHQTLKSAEITAEIVIFVVFLTCDFRVVLRLAVVGGTRRDAQVSRHQVDGAAEARRRRTARRHRLRRGDGRTADVEGRIRRASLQTGRG